MYEYLIFVSTSLLEKLGNLYYINSMKRIFLLIYQFLRNLKFKV